MENGNNRQIKLCTACGAKNKTVYRFCNECGTPLSDTVITEPDVVNEQSSQQYSQNTDSYTYQYHQSPYDNVNTCPDFGDVTAAEVYEYSGKNDKRFNILKDLHFFGKNKYCVPLLLLGLFTGLWGMSCWFVYHRLYKPAIGLLCGAIADFSIRMVFVFNIFYNMMKILPQYMDEIIASGNSSEVTMQITEELMFNSPAYLLASILFPIFNLTILGLAVILPIFAYKYYKNNLLMGIRNAKMQNPNPNLAAAGKRRTGLVVLFAGIGASAWIGYIVIAFAYLLISMFSMVNDYVENNPNGYNTQNPLSSYSENYNDW